MAARITITPEDLQALVERAVADALKQAKSAPVKPVASAFVQARAAARTAKLDAGTHRECPNCGAAVSKARTIELCKTCYHAGPAERKARARKAR